MWVFGYGSLVSPISLGSTLGRSPVPGVDFLAAECEGFARRWNYGVRYAPGSLEGRADLDVLVFLGLVAAPDTWTNGIVARVNSEELRRLDARERDYDRVEITDRVRLIGTAEDVSLGTIVIYVPRPEAVAVYSAGRDERRAAVVRSYWDLVDDAFALLAPGQGERYRASTPAPDVPVVDVVRP